MTSQQTLIMAATLCAALVGFPAAAEAEERDVEQDRDARVTLQTPEVRGNTLSLSGRVPGVNTGMLALHHREEGFRWRRVASSDVKNGEYAVAYPNIAGKYRVSVTAEGGFSGESRVVEVQGVKRSEPLEWVVALGDSYMSGEGASYAGYGPQGGNRHKPLTSDDDWWITAFGSGLEQTYPGDWPANQPLAQPALAHLSVWEREAYGIRLTGTRCHRSRSAGMYWNAPDFPAMNLACSGAVVSTKPDLGKPGIDFHRGDGLKGQALMLQEFAQGVKRKGDSIGTVLLSIGGNDIGFSSIVEDCLKRYMNPVKPACSRTRAASEAQKAYRNGEGLQDARNAVAVAGSNIVEALRRAGFEPGSYTIQVQTYPMAVPPSQQFEKDFGGNSGYGRQGVGGCGFTDADLDFFNGEFGDLLRRRTIEGARSITSRNPGTKVTVMDATDAFRGHELCSSKVDYPKKSSWGTNTMTPDWYERGSGLTGSWVSPVIISCVGTTDKCSEDEDPAKLYPRLWEAVDGAGAFRSPRWMLALEELKQLAMHPSHWGQRQLAACHDRTSSQSSSAWKIVKCVPGGTALDEFGRPQVRITHVTR